MTPSIFDRTEADDATTLLGALASFAWQVEQDETMGVIDMYERTERRLGATNEAIDNTRTAATRKRDARLIAE
jgi:hypothetical protein